MTKAVPPIRQAEMRVDWLAVIAGLKRAELSAEDISRHTGICRSSVRNWSNRLCEPRHSAGERLLRLWSTVTQLPREAVPMISTHDWRA